jgi:hypothetical protein
MQDYYDAVERGVERAAQWRPSDEDPLRSGLVETYKLITPRDRPDEPVWLIEARDRDGNLWSKFISEVALQVKLIGERLDTKEKVEAADPEAFTVRVGSFVAIKFQGKHPSRESPGQTVTRWNVSGLDPEREAQEEVAADDIPY